jgi:uncharacterized membrane protein
MVLGLTLALWLMVIPVASAYIDPGSTTVVFQAVIAGLAAAGMGLRMFWGRISAFFRRGRSSDAEESSALVEGE